jgi:lipopolysaccharide/colanic/teichoic acid biosynthesis glycosyltransferase
MEVQSELKEKRAWTTLNDPRVTRIGKIIRKTSIDELPQLFNVLKGEMSLVGPRPERPFFVEKFKEEIPRYMIKHQVQPGLTGWAQINGYRGDTSIRKRIEYDLYYIENWTLGLDIKILFLTVFKGFINKNAY